jgi:glutaredoxin
MRMPQLDVVLYTREGCHLCAEAQQALEKYGLRCQLVDIDLEPELRAKYDLCVPVVAINGRERFRGKIDELLLRRIISAGG